MAEIKLFNIDLEGYRNKIQALRSELSQLNNESQDYNQTQRELYNTTNELSNAIASSNPAMSELKNILQQLKTEWANANSEADRGSIATQIGIIEGQMKSMNQELKNTSQNASAAEGSYNALVVKLRELQQAAKATGDAAERMALSKKANEVNDQLKGMDAEMGNFQRNVGSYEESISSAFGQLASSMGPVAKSTGQFGKVIGGLDGPIQVAVGAVGGLGKAFKALKAAIVANPVGLIITVCVAAGVALLNLIQKTKTLSQEEQILKIKADAAARALEEQQNANQVLGNKVGDLLGTYRKLQIQWNSLKNDSERTKWIATQREEIHKLGGKVNNLTDAWIFFVKNSPKVIEALQAIAEAEAHGELYKEAIKKKASRPKNVESGDYYKPVKSGDVVRSTKGLVEGKDYTAVYTTVGSGITGYTRSLVSGYKLTKSGAKKVNKQKNKEALARRAATEAGYDAAIQQYGEGYKQALLKAEDASKKAGLSRNGYNGGNNGSNNGYDSSSGNSGSSNSIKEQKDEALAALEELRDSYHEFDSELQANTSHTLELIDQNIGASTDFTNGVESSGNFEIDQLERKKKAEDQYYIDSSSARRKYQENLQKEEKKAQDDLLKGEKNNDTELIKSARKRLEIISKEQKKAREAEELENAKYYNRQYKTYEAIDDELQKEKDEQLTKIQEQYDYREKAAQNAYDTEIGLAQQRISDKEILNQEEQQAQLTHLNAEIENEKWYIEQLIQLYDENAPIVQAAKARLTSLQGEASQLGGKINNPEKKQKDHLKAVMGTVDAIGSLTGKIADFWKSSTQAQLDAGEITQEEAEKQFEKIKAFEVASAIATTIAGALHSQMSVWKDSSLPLWGKIAMSALLGAETLISGYTQVKQIEATKIGSTTGDSSSITVANATPLLDEAQDVNQLTSLNVNGDSGSDSRVYILQSDIVETTNQNKVRVKQSTF